MEVETTIAAFSFATQKFTCATASTAVIVIFRRGSRNAAATLRRTGTSLVLSKFRSNSVIEVAGVGCISIDVKIAG